jgi:hypothetical protein
MKATLLFRTRQRFDDGAILEAVIWRVPEPVPGSKHRFKYRLYYGHPGQRAIGYDNERGKGDHRHRGTVERFYLLTTPEKLWHDFMADVNAARRKS